MDIRGLAQQFITYVAGETDNNGNRRSASTISGYRRAMEGFVAAAEAFNGGNLSGLPENFIETHWMETQQSVADKPIQIRVRIGALKQFSQWCHRNNVACAPMTYPQIKTPPRKKKEEPVTDLNSLGDVMQVDPVPSTTNVVPMQNYSQAPYVEQAPQRAAPPPQKAAPKPNGSGRPANPLATLLPSGQYKLRVRREREMDDPVWVADFPAERVAVHGALEPFLGREVAPRLAVQGLTGDVTFLVSAVGPTGTEGERARITVAIPAAPIASAPAPVMAPMGVMTPPPQGADIAETLAYHRRAQEELEERLTKRIEQQRPSPAQEERRPQRNDEMDDLKRMVGSLASTVRDLAERLEDRDRDRDRLDGLMAQQQPAPAAPPQLDLLAVIKEVAAMTNKQAAPPPPAPPQPGIMEMFSMMAQAKQMFAPAQVNIDVSPLEDQIAEINKRLESTTKKKGEVSEVLSTMRDVKELMALMGVAPAGGKDKSGLGSALGSLVDKIVNDPEPIAMAVERVLKATAEVKAANTSGRAPTAQAPAQPRDPLPPQLRSTTDALLSAQGDAAIVAAAYEWITALGNVPQTKKLADRLTSLLREQKINELTVYLRQILTHFGYGDRVGINVIQTIAQTLVAQVRKANDASDEEESEDTEDDGNPDLTVRVGRGRGEEAADDSDEEEVEASDDDGDEDEEADEPADEVVEEEDEPVVEAVEPEPAPRRGRRKKEVMTPADDMTPDPLLAGAV